MKKEESHFTADKERDSKVENSFVFYSGAYMKKRKEYHSILKCDHCRKTGHVKEKCFEVVGYPASWESRRTQRQEPNKLGGQQVVNFAQSAERKECPKATTTRHTLHEVHGKNHANTHENMTDKFEYHFNWILGNGISHHMTSLTSILKKVGKLDKSFYITTRTGILTLVENMGDVNLSSSFTLKDVLLVPDFK